MIWGAGGADPIPAAGCGPGLAARTGPGPSLPPRPGIRGHGSRPRPAPPAGQAGTGALDPGHGCDSPAAPACGGIDHPGHGLGSPLPAPAAGTRGTQTQAIPGLCPAPRACLSFPSHPGEPGAGLRVWELGRDGFHQIFGYLFASLAGSAPQGINPWPQRGLLGTWGRLSSRKRIKQRTGNVGMGSESPRAALASGGDKGTVPGTGTHLGADTGRAALAWGAAHGHSP